MIFIAMLVKVVAWFFAFLSAARCSLNGMLLRAALITVFLTVVDRLSVASNLAFPAILLTLILYALLSFTLIPLGWKLKKGVLCLALNLAGALGAFALVNFIMDFLRGLLPFMNK